MNTEALVKMANQIGDFFEAMPDRPEARQGVAHHIHSFWAPCMRRELLAHLDQHGASQLKPIVTQALAAHRDMLG
ncbi:MAG: formate dehydrogenase subunit delta [Burkholderiales bacterium]